LKVVWSLSALRDLRTQQLYIARTQPAAATRVAQRIKSAANRLATYPRYGRQVAWDATRHFRELPVATTPFVVLYTTDIAADTILIVRVVHGAQFREP